MALENGSSRGDRRLLCAGFVSGHGGEATFTNMTWGKDPFHAGMDCHYCSGGTAVGQRTNREMNLRIVSIHEFFVIDRNHYGARSSQTPYASRVPAFRHWRLVLGSTLR